MTEPSTTAHPNAADRTWIHVYDEAGNPKATIQPGGVRIDRTFDRLGRLTKESGAGGAATAERTFGYDLADRRTTAGDLTVDYNDRGVPLKVSRGTTQETAYSYDGIGSPTQRIDAAGTAPFTYDNANRLKTATDPVTSRTLTYGYDAVSRLKTITASSGTATATTTPDGSPPGLPPAVPSPATNGTPPATAPRPATRRSPTTSATASPPATAPTTPTPRAAPSRRRPRRGRPRSTPSTPSIGSSPTATASTATTPLTG